MSASSARVTNEDLRQQMRDMLEVVKALPRTTPDEVAALRRDVGEITPRLVRIESKQDFFAAELQTACARVAKLEERGARANGAHAEFDKNIEVLKLQVGGHNVNWSRAWVIINAVLLAVMLAVVSRLWTVLP